MGHRNRIQKLLVNLIILPLMIIIGSGGATGQEKRLAFFYFNPDSLQSNLGRLKSVMDTFFSQTNLPIAFQPFAHLTDLENTLKTRHPAFLLLPDWFFRKHEKELGLRPLLQPMRDNRKFYHKVLLAQADSGITLQNLQDRSLAMTTMGSDSEALLDTILFANRGINAASLNIIVVPKDTDALFALTLGQVDLALVVKDNIDEVADVNPRILRSVKPLLSSAPIPMPLICYVQGTVSPKELQRFKDVFLDNTQDAMGIKVMELLKINDWQDLSQ